MVPAIKFSLFVLRVGGALTEISSMHADGVAKMKKHNGSREHAPENGDGHVAGYVF